MDKPPHHVTTISRLRFGLLLAPSVCLTIWPVFFSYKEALFFYAWSSQWSKVYFLVSIASLGFLILLVTRSLRQFGLLGFSFVAGIWLVPSSSVLSQTFTHGQLLHPELGIEVTSGVAATTVAASSMGFILALDPQTVNKPLLVCFCLGVFGFASLVFI